MGRVFASLYFCFETPAGVENHAADALSHRHTLLSIVSIEVVGFDKVKENYEECPDFGDILITLCKGPSRERSEYTLQDGYLFRETRLCIPRTSLRDFLVWELHAGGLAGHFGRNKTIELVEAQFFWPSLKRDVARIVAQCRTCAVAKQRK